MRGGDSDTLAMIDCLCTASSKELAGARKEFGKFSNVELDVRVKGGHASAPLRQIFDAVLNRQIVTPTIDQDVEDFYKATVGTPAIDLGIICRLLARNDRSHLVQQLAPRFKTKYGQEVSEVLLKEAPGHLQLALLACFIPDSQWHAIRLHQTLRGVETV